MITLRRSGERGHTRLSWLDSRHTFSFGDYRDPDHMGYRTLRVINDDRIRPGSGFGSHPHRNMEILTWVLEGALAHQDSLGSVQLLEAGELQVMTAGRGIVHSEMNGAPQETHFLQIWIRPEAEGLPPAYAQQPLPAGEGLHLVAAPAGRGGALPLHQDALVHAGHLRADTTFSYELGEGRHAWIHVARGQVRLGDHVLESGDGASVTGPLPLEILAQEPSDVLLFDLA